MAVLMDSIGRPRLSTNLNGTALFSEIYEWGYRLAETSAGVDKNTPGGLWEARGWKELVGHMPDDKKVMAAIMLENCRSKFGQMNETTRTGNLGTFDKWIFPVISNMTENDIIDQLVAVQPMPGPTSNIVYMDIVTSQAKGRVPAGSPMWRALQGPVDRYNDADEIVEEEELSTTNGLGAASGTLEYTPVRAGNVQIVIGAEVMTDDGNGALSGTAATGTINYSDGSITIIGAPATTAVLVTYVFDSEGSQNTMAYEMKLSTHPVTAKVYKLRTRWSEEADQNLQALYNIKAESILLTALTNALQYQKHRSVIADLRRRANAGLVTWDGNPPANVNYQTHKFSIVDAFETASNFIYGATNTMRGNWVHCGLQAYTIVATLPQFTAKGDLTEMQGVTFAGNLGHMRVFADPHYPNDEFLVGYKGDQWLRTGYVLAEYQKLYTTPNIVLPDFINQRGFATSFAKKLINGKCYARGKILNAPTDFGPNPLT